MTILNFEEFKNIFIERDFDDDDVFKMPIMYIRMINDDELHKLYNYYLHRDINNFMTEWLKIRSIICGINYNFNFYSDKNKFIYNDYHAVDKCGEDIHIFLESLIISPTITLLELQNIIKRIKICFKARCEYTKNIIINDHIRWSKLFEGDILIKQNLDNGHSFILLKLGAIYSIYSFLLLNYENFNFTSLRINIQKNTIFNIYIKSKNNVIYYLSPYLLMDPILLDIYIFKTIKFHNTYTCVLGNYFSTYWKRIFNAYLAKNKDNLLPRAYKIKYINIKIITCTNVEEKLYTDYIDTYTITISDDKLMINREIQSSPNIGFIYGDIYIPNKRIRRHIYSKILYLDKIEDIYKIANGIITVNRLGITFDSIITELPEYNMEFSIPPVIKTSNISDTSDIDDSTICSGAGCAVRLPDIDLPLQNEYHEINGQKILKGTLSSIETIDILHMFKDMCFTKRLDIILDEIEYLNKLKLTPKIKSKIDEIYEIYKMINMDFEIYKAEKNKYTYPNKDEIKKNDICFFGGTGYPLLLANKTTNKIMSNNDNTYSMWKGFTIYKQMEIIQNTFDKLYFNIKILKMPLNIKLRLFIALCEINGIIINSDMMNNFLKIIEESSKYNAMAILEAKYEYERVISINRSKKEENIKIDKYTNLFYNTDYNLPVLDKDKIKIIIKFFIITWNVEPYDKLRMIYTIMTHDKFIDFIDELKEELLIENIIHEIEYNDFLIYYEKEELVDLYIDIVKKNVHIINDTIDSILCDIEDENLPHLSSTTKQSNRKNKKLKYLSYESKYLKYKTKYLNYKKINNI